MTFRVTREAEGVRVKLSRAAGEEEEEEEKVIVPDGEGTGN